MGYRYNGRSQPYQPGQKDAYKISRSKIELFVDCPRCFWLDARLKISRPSGPPFTLNSAVDQLLKQEFDALRKDGKQHPLQIEYGIDSKPVDHDKLNVWRHNFTGVQHLHDPTNLLVFGAIDDLWQDGDGKYVVVDYKSTSKMEKIEKLGDASWHDAYRRQLAVYQWLLRGNGLKVSDKGYWVYCNAIKDGKVFDKKLEFEITLIEEKIDDSWVEPALNKIKETLEGPMPKESAGCEHCGYARSRTELTLDSIQSQKRVSKTKLL
ncbi:MAG TPA: PD-(D/E)XK nuclease family protein [Candidatus Saccharimonadales bacterium]|nr:PD-(D/E)XK nuclease family protein [Candidatus Saccharimonadales bacterium]